MRPGHYYCQLITDFRSHNPTAGQSPHSQDLPPFLFALGVGFPKTEHDTEKANYKVNLVELKNWIEIPDEPDDEEWP